jgi:hypothetical protein
VTSFLATLEPGQLGHGATASIATRTSPPRPHRLLHSQPPTATLEVSLAADGLPVRTVIAVHVTTLSKAHVTTTSTLEIPAINFPLVIEPPPADQTLTVEQRRALERRRMHSKHRQPPSRSTDSK